MIRHNFMYYKKLQVYRSAFTQNISLTPFCNNFEIFSILRQFSDKHKKFDRNL